MKIFENEQKLQKWLSRKFKGDFSLADIIVNRKDFTETSDYTDKPLEFRKINDSFIYCLRSLYNNEVITENENISLNPEDRLKPDFLLYAPDTESIVIVELKNLSGPTRQAGTELSAYAAEVRSLLPFISEGEVINVIISTEWPTLQGV